MTEWTPEPALLCDAVELAGAVPAQQPALALGRQRVDTALYAGLSRVMTAADPQGREIYLSCGAALDHLVAAMAAEGWDTDVHRFPD